jgi:hypothetical protein
MRKMISASNQLLAGLIFILWSIGLLVLPAIQKGQPAVTSLSNPLAFSVILLYGALHICIFIYTLYKTVVLVRTAPRRKSAVFYWQSLLYAYILLSLALSFYLLVIG